MSNNASLLNYNNQTLSDAPVGVKKGKRNKKKHAGDNRPEDELSLWIDKNQVKMFSGKNY
jgi:hypothetical protein